MAKPQNLGIDIFDYFYESSFCTSQVQILLSSLTTRPGLVPFLGPVGFGSFIFQTNQLTGSHERNQLWILLSVWPTIFSIYI